MAPVMNGDQEPTAIPVIDLWSPVVPSLEIVEHMALNNPPELLQYLEVFTKQRIDEKAFEAYARSRARDDAEILAELDEAGVRLSLVTGFDEASTCGRTFVSNEAVAALAERHPDRFIPFAGVDIMRGTSAIRELRRWLKERSFRGVSVRPFMIGEPASHRAYWPVFELCTELGVPVSIHSSANWTRTRPSDLGHPRHLDDVACSFPDLAIIMSHAGYPWVLEACLVAWKHPNVYLELGAHRPRYFTTTGAGWEPLLQYGATTIAHKVCYGSGAFLMGRPYRTLVDEMLALPLERSVLEQWLWRNAARLLSLPELERTAADLVPRAVSSAEGGE
jgi:uncharacterized protein